MESAVDAERVPLLAVAPPVRKVMLLPVAPELRAPIPVKAAVPDVPVPILTCTEPAFLRALPDANTRLPLDSRLCGRAS